MLVVDDEALLRSAFSSLIEAQDDLEVADLAVSDSQVRIQVADDGGTAARPPGEDGRPASPGTGHGIVGMRARIGAFGGWLVAEPLAGRGFHVLAEVPVEGAA